MKHDPRLAAVSHACQMSKLKQIIRRLHDILLVPRHRRGRRPWFSRSHRQMCRLISLPLLPSFFLLFPSLSVTSSLVLRLEAWRAFNRASREQKFHSRFHFETASIAPSSRFSLLDFFFNNVVEIYRHVSILRGKVGKSFTGAGLVPSRSLIHGVNIDGTGVESFRYIYIYVCV